LGKEERSMGTRKFGASLIVLLSLLSLVGCRSMGCRCQEGSCEAPRGASAEAGYLPESNPVVVEASYGGQKTCPVTGASLSGVARPLPVTVKGQTIYVCCSQCAAKVKANPHAYLARVAAERLEKVTASPVTSLPATVGPYGGQITCPVTGEQLDPVGGAIPVTVRGQTVYVCCKACAAKVKRDPDTYLARVIAERAAGTSSR
jgi:YHS domain-containing protein